MNELRAPDPSLREKIHRVLGYLNFSSGADDPAMLRELNELFYWAANPDTAELPYEVVLKLLSDELARASTSEKTFADATQAQNVLQVVSQKVLSTYLLHHRDLLFHRTPESLFNSFFIGRVFQATLQLYSHHEDPNDWARRTVGKLNDFIGHRLVAVLESQKLEPYENEWVRPTPIYIREAGVAVNRHSEVIECAIRLLHETDPQILQVAQFDPSLLDELALDPRSFDFDHPVNKRPNHHFGQWDEHHIDSEGRYRRFVIHQVTLDALTARIDDGSAGELPKEELIFEAGAVLAGTILMAAGICGWGPGAHDSTITLGRLLPGIAWYRDQFYSDLLSQLEGQHQSRLVEEVTTRQQPFGAARQHLNQQLARYRAFQMVHVHLALIFSRMGYEDAAMQHVNVLPVASARMFCQIECLMFSGTQAIDSGDLAMASDMLPRIFDLVKRAIQCGALIDPWNILGFDANYNLFQGTENTIRDHRADDLVELMEQVFCFASQVWIASQADDQVAISNRVKDSFHEIVQWWHQFAVHEVSSMGSADCQEIFAATGDVATLLSEWQKKGAQTGDVQFWAQHARSFVSPRTYILAIHSLIERDDYVTSMALLIHWLTQSETIPLQQSSGSFQALVADWLSRQHSRLNDSPSAEAYHETWKRVQKFCDYVEANAGDFWNVPVFRLKSNDSSGGNEELLDTAPHPDDNEDLYHAAYENMVFRESVGDREDGGIFDSGQHSEESIQAEMHRIAVRIEFLHALSDYWVAAAMFVNEQVGKGLAAREEAAKGGKLKDGDASEPLFDNALLAAQKQKIEDWAKQAERNCRDIESLLVSVQGYPLPQPDGSGNSLAEYDRHRLFKEMLLDSGIGLHVSTASSARFLSALAERLRQVFEDGKATEGVTVCESGDEKSEQFEQRCWQQMFASVLGGDCDAVKKQLPGLMELMSEKPLLYVPLSKSGAPMQIVSTRVRQGMMGQLLESLPKLGLLQETRELIHLALLMERNQTVRQGAVTEFDELFRIGYSGMVESLIAAFERREKGSKDGAAAAVAQPNQSDDDSVEQPPVPKADRKKNPENSLFDSLEMLAESMLMLWLSHSQTLRLSVLEKVRDPAVYEQLVSFIDQFGEQIFTQQFLSLSNIRAILHQGVDAWLNSVENEEDEDDLAWEIIEKINAGYPRTDVVRHMTCVLESIIENFNEYRDYNCTTTQSDNGRLLYVLLDFLRLRGRYDQVCWNLKPVIWAHEILVRSEKSDVAQLWRRLLADRVSVESEKLLGKLGDLQQKHSIQMATVSQRINERFVHPMQVDRLTSLVAQAMEDPTTERSQAAFEMIESYAESLTKLPIGIGFELPGWISALQEEVDLTSAQMASPAAKDEHHLIQNADVSVEELCKQLRAMPHRES